MRDGRCVDGEQDAEPEPASGAVQSSLSRRWWPSVGASQREWWEGVRTALCVV